MNKVINFKPVKDYEVFVCSLNNEHKWKITVKAFGHSHAYRKAESLHNVTVLSTHLLMENKAINGRSFRSRTAD